MLPTIGPSEIMKEIGRGGAYLQGALARVELERMPGPGVRFCVKNLDRLHILPEGINWYTND